MTNLPVLAISPLRKRLLDDMSNPGAISDYIRDRGLLPADEVDRIAATAPRDLVAFQTVQACLPVSERRSMGQWLHDFQRAAEAGSDAARISADDPASI